MLRASVHDVVERMTGVATLLGTVTLGLSELRDTERCRIPLAAMDGSNVGFLTMQTWEVKETRVLTTRSRNCSPLAQQVRYSCLQIKKGSKLKDGT